MANEFISSKLSGDMLGGLDRFEAKIKERVLLAGVAAMAKAQYDEARANAEKNKKSGLLLDNIYRAYVPNRSTDSVKTYVVSWRKAPWAAPHGHLIEFGHWRKYAVVQLANGAWISLKNQPLPNPVWVPAQPFIRPAFDKIDAAIKAGKERMAQVLSQGGGTQNDR